MYRKAKVIKEVTSGWLVVCRNFLTHSSHYNANDDNYTPEYENSFQSIISRIWHEGLTI